MKSAARLHFWVKFERGVVTEEDWTSNPRVSDFVELTRHWEL